TVILVFSIPVTAQNNNRGRSAEITYSPNASHIAKISRDSIILITGTTYSFTVDTPEDQGLISTKLDAGQLTTELASMDGSSQQYQLTGKDGTIKTTGDIENGDKIIVISEDKTVNKTYHVGITKMALSGRLQLEQNSITVNSSCDL